MHSQRWIATTLCTAGLCTAGLCAVGLSLGGCSDREATTSASRTTNASLESAIQSRLASDPALSEVRVSADAEKNQVTLSGSVETQDQRMRATEFARAVNPALTVADTIDVKPREIVRSEYTEDMARQAREKAKAIGEKIGASLDDAWLYTKITSKLVADKDTPARTIHVDVVNGVVSLRGKVDTASAKGEAERLAKETEGVKRVINLLTVQSL
jgi:osmotically-inducible protein OsmY